MADDDPQLPPAPPAPAPAPGAGLAPAPARVSPARRIAAWVLSVLGVLIVVAVAVGFVVHVPYVIITPGTASPLDSSVITIQGAPTYGHSGNVLYLTVQVSSSDPNLWRYVVASLDPDADVQPRQKVVGCLSDVDNTTYNAELMTQSQSDATKVALEHLGYTVTASSPRLVVIQACKGVPAYGHLHVGDQIVAIDNTPVPDQNALSAAIASHAPGDEIAVTVVRDGTTVTVQSPTGQFKSESNQCVTARAATGSPCFGIVVQQFVNYDFPVDVSFDLARVGGPSAGLAFSLAVVDDLTPGDLTGGKRVAVTGAIAPDGRVQPVGGVEQKAITARTNGVDLMIVPQSELADAKKGAKGLRVVGVRTFDDALAALQSAGGAPVPPPTTTAARS